MRKNTDSPEPSDIFWEYVGSCYIWHYQKVHKRYFYSYNSIDAFFLFRDRNSNIKKLFYYDDLRNFGISFKKFLNTQYQPYAHADVVGYETRFRIYIPIREYKKNLNPILGF